MSAERPRILVAEDDRLLRHILTRHVAEAGYAVEVARNGVEAVEALSSEEFDVALLDVRMPGVDGIEIARRQRQSAKRIHIVTLTADANGDVYNRCMDAGVDVVLSKPCSRRTLLDTIQSLLTSQRLPTTPMKGRRISDPEGVMDRGRMLEHGLINESGEPVPAIVAAFVGNARSVVDQMLGAITRGDIGEVLELAHRLKGSAGSYGAQRLADCCDGISRDEDLNAFATTLRKALNDTVRALSHED